MINTTITGDQITYASAFTSNLSFLLAVVIGIVATYFVFRAASKMGGGLFGLVLNYVGTGMIFIVIGAVSVALRAYFEPIWLELGYIVFFSLGFVFLVIGAEKLLKGITAN
ncbi:MAG: hypothetical protein AAB392_01180 [Patescibacteria group bacterium]